MNERTKSGPVSPNDIMQYVQKGDGEKERRIRTHKKRRRTNRKKKKKITERRTNLNRQTKTQRKKK